MAGKKRMANYELLRSLAMIMVVTLHFLSRSDSLIALGVPLDGVRIVGTALEFCCIAAVNVYVLISGYFGIKSSFKPSRAVKFLCQIWFYALLIPLALQLAGLSTQASELGIYGVIKYVFPIETEHYWFATSYFMLYLLTPVLEAGVRSMTRKQMQIMLGGLFILFCGIKSVNPVGFVTDRYGYDLPWFICVYLLAAYLGMYGSEFLEKRGWLLYLGSVAAGFGIHIGMYFLAAGRESLQYYFTVPFHYNFIFSLTGALGLFYGFSRLKIKEGWMAGVIRKVGALSFGVYLLHEHVDLRDRWYEWIRTIINPGKEKGMIFFLWELVCSMIILFMAGVVIDWLRSKLFRLFGAMSRKTWFYKKLKEMDGAFAKSPAGK